MATNHHIHLTTQIVISTSKKNINNDDLRLLLPQPYRDDFEVTYSEDYIQESPKLPDGTRLKWEKKYIVYALKKKYLKNVQSFIIEILLMAKEILNKQIKREWYDRFIEEFKQLNISTETLYSPKRRELETLSDKLKEIEENMFTAYERISDRVVYDGFPESLKEDNRSCTIIGFNIVHSYFEFKENLDETIGFDKLKEKIKQQESKYPVLTKYVYHLGY